MVTKKEDFQKKDLTKKSKNLSRWYTEVIQRAELADYGPARGTMVIRPYGYAIWENVQKEFNQAVERLGAENAYFPLFIPMSLLQKEKEHVEGFSPELAIVTHGGGKKLAEPLAVRPTSETIMYAMYAKWISSWRDLPLKINQWNNVVRWEKRIYFFLRSLEFLWQEGHTAHATPEEAEQLTLSALREYEQIYQEVYALPTINGLKSESEKFAGADHTYSVELLMPNGKALQGATSHNLGQNFSKAFNISFQDQQGKTKYVCQTSWGLSTRSLGGLILAHGDDQGLILPPKLAPIKVVIIPVLGKRDEQILNYCQKVKKEIEKNASIFPGKAKIFSDPEKSFGWKVNQAELQGIPIRLTIGGRELDEKLLTLNTRIDQKKKEQLIRLGEISEKVEQILGEIQTQLYQQARKELEERIYQTEDYPEFKEIIKDQKKRGLIKAYWCEEKECEEKIKNETKATTRVKPLNQKPEKGKKCIHCQKPAQYLWYFAQAY